MPRTETEIPSQKPLRIGFLASHRGTDMRAIVEAISQGSLCAIPAVVISNNTETQNKDATALRYAVHESPIPFDAVHISRKSDGVEKTDEEVDRLIASTLEEHDVDVVILCGYMRMVGEHTLGAFEGRIFNIHPALLPDFKGHWGDVIHRKAIQRRRDHPDIPDYRWTGVTIHRVNDVYDEGEHVRQAALKIPDYLTPDDFGTLKQKVQSLEQTLYIALLQDVANGILVLPPKKTPATRR